MIKKAWNILETAAVSIWGITIIDLYLFIDNPGIEIIDLEIKKIMAILGALYFVVNLPFKIGDLFHKRIMQKIAKKQAEENLEKIIRENDLALEKLLNERKENDKNLDKHED